jgi:hypothetical protein
MSTSWPLTRKPHEGLILVDSSASGLFLRAGTTLVELSEQPYDAERELQLLLAAHP